MTFNDFLNDCIADCVDGEDSEHTRRAAVARPLYKCASPNCPGFTYRASVWPHPADICTEGAVQP